MSIETGSIAGVSRLSSTEVRVLGCLLEKQRTTPDAYPLSLNALRLACNQSTNRDPVVEYDDAVLRDALHRLERRGYTRLASGAGSRAPKYRHLLAEALPMADDEQAVVCVLMLRGPQTPGELKQRTERMHAFADLGEVHQTLERLIGRGLVAALERRPGQKEERYIQLLEEESDSAATAHRAGLAAAPAPTPSAFSSHLPGGPGVSGVSGVGPSVSSNQTAGASAQAGAAAPVESPLRQTVEALEERVAHLENEVTRLRAALGDSPEEEEPHRSGEPEGHVGERRDRSEETLGWT